MLQIFDEEYGQLELWMEFYPCDPFELPEELKQMAQILDRIEILQLFIDQYAKAVQHGELAIYRAKNRSVAHLCRYHVSIQKLRFELLAHLGSD